MTRTRHGLGIPVLLGTLVLALAAVLVCGCAGTATSTPDDASAQVADDAEGSVDPDDPYATGIHHATIEVEGYGTIEITLNANVAPVTVSNFCHLAEEGFYDGLTFHRVVPGFVVQGGDPAGDGTGGSDQTIKGEFSDNGVKNSIPHVRGTVSMARSSDYDSASSQFFICVDTASSLDGQYAAFGNVTSGMDVVDAICESVPVQDESSGLVAPEDQPVITSVRIVD